MTQMIRPATPDDMPRLVELLMLDAQERHAEDAILWKMADDAPTQIEKALTFALTAEQQPFQQFWHVADDGGQITGVIHAMILPVPPIYAGSFGEPGLILPDSFVAADAPSGTLEGLLAAAEGALHEAGARIKLASFVTGEIWRTAFEKGGYEPLTLYLSRSDLGDQGMPAGVRQATENDVSGIVARSAENRQVLFDIDPFWEIHPEADPRFSAWMTRSLTLRDRDMMVLGASEDLQGYIIAQPASRLHFPPAHDITGTGVIDDYYHLDLANPAALDRGAQAASVLLRAAETAFVNRGMGAAFVVCPAGWKSKIELLESAGYEIAMVWSIKR
ncbi:hypothetical protein Q4577_19200 [Marinovum sp. 2_MG-2023]|uniref:hypothetical protein n=1 Tax=unclassified Marinovum TaxID=2647166 RepID=UPI0026E47395|nr:MULTISPECIES: hypothetical protein [unclassified Marinovum]MDO6732164.1 hypothetical protein [Marinovum sp. 2_MG-2023]MDO6781481.1 hypothetical protein [Marinovum sp. 1_MG-2023]